MSASLDLLFGAHLQEVMRRSGVALADSQFDRLLIHAGEPVGVFRDDTEYPYKPHAIFRWWAPLLDAPGSMVEWIPGERPRLYFRAATDFWYQPPQLPVGGWPEHFDIVTVSSWEAMVEALAKQPARKTAWLSDRPPTGLPECVQSSPAALWQQLEFARSRKTGYEIACLREANALGAKGHRAAEAAFHAEGSEFEIHQAFLAGCGQREQELPYNAIVGVNEAASVLHYQILKRRSPTPVRSLLLDAGASCRGYGSDITRTYARSAEGPFSALVEAMDQMQQGLAQQVVPGADWKEIHLAAVRGVADILSSAEIVRCSGEEATALGLTRLFFPHGIGHMLGLQVHDVAGLWADDRATTIPRPPQDPALRLTRILEPGFVVTLEPGLYFIESLLAPLRHDAALREKLNWALIDSLKPFGGVRIEDNLALTSTGHENLTRVAFG
ncbi:MAG: Xaa-Pro dipeptidase [Steroidobacteraceae bacterium]|jgi:Xaa-Pro dipeptidase